MNNFISHIWINLIVISLYFVGPIFAKTGTMFIDEIYEAKRINDIQYGKGSTGNPASGSIDLFLDLYQPNGINLKQKKPALIVIHGGAFTLGTKKLQLFLNYANPLPNAVTFAPPFSIVLPVIILPLSLAHLLISMIDFER